MKISRKFTFPIVAASLITAAIFTGGNASAALLVHYTFDDVLTPGLDTGTTPAANATAIGAGSSFVTNTPSGTGFAYSTNGANSYLTTGTTANPDTGTNPAKLDGLGSFTLSTWINFSAVPASNDRLISDWIGSTGFDFRIGTVTSTTYQPYLTIDGANIATSGSLSALNTWVFLAVTYNGAATTNNVTFYSATATTPVTQLGTLGSAGVGATDANTVDLQIGGTAATTSDRSPAALFDDVRIYDEALSASALEAIRLQTIPEPASALLGALGLISFGLIRRR